MGVFDFRTRFQKNSNLEFFKKCEGLLSEFFQTQLLLLFQFFRFFGFFVFSATAVPQRTQLKYNFTQLISNTTQFVGSTPLHLFSAAVVVEDSWYDLL